MNRYSHLDGPRTAESQPRVEHLRARLPRRTLSRALRLLALTVLATGVAGAVSAAPSYASTTTTSFLHYPVKSLDPTCTQTGGRFGERTASASVGPNGDAGADFNTDGVNDVWVAQPFCDIGGNVDQGRVFLLSGADMARGVTTILKTIDSPIPQANAKFGFFISVIADPNNAAATPNIAIGTDSQDVSANTDQGIVWVFDGDPATPSTPLYTINNPKPQASARFGSRIGNAGLVDADTVPDIIVGASNNDVGANVDQGQAFIFSGATGTLIRTLNQPASSPNDAITNGHFGLSVQSPGDVTGDGKADQLVDATNFTGGLTNQGRLYLFDGATGNLVRTIDDPAPQASAFFGFQDVAPQSPGDLNGDKKAEIYANGFLQDAGGVTDSGEAWVFDGATGNLRSTLIDPTPEAGGQFGWSMSKTDYNKPADDINDLYIGQAPHTSALNHNGGTYVFDGASTTGSVFKSLELPTQCRQTGTASDNGPALGWTVTTPGNLNAATTPNTNPDYIAGAPFFNRTSTDEGVVLGFMSDEPASTTKAC